MSTSIRDDLGHALVITMFAGVPRSTCFYCGCDGTGSKAQKPCPS